MSWVGVVDGMVKLVSLSRQREDRSPLLPCRPDSWFGEGSVLKHERRHAVIDVVALRESRVALMPETTFFWLLDNSIPFNRFILDQLNERLGPFHVALSNMTGCSILTRASRASLADMFHPQLYPGHERCIELSQDELGVSSVRRVNGSARRCRFLKRRPHQGRLPDDQVLDVEGLRRFGD